MFFQHLRKFGRRPSASLPPDRLGQIRYTMKAFKARGWRVTTGSSPFRDFWVISPQGTIISIKIADQKLRGGTESEWVRLEYMGAAFDLSKGEIRFVVLAPFSTTAHAYKQAFEQRFIIMNFHELEILLCLIDVSKLHPAHIDDRQLYILSQNLGLCRNFSKSLLQARNIDSSIRWAEAIIRHKRCTADDYDHVAKVRAARGDGIGAVFAAETACRMRPSDEDLTSHLAELIKMYPATSEWT